MVKKSHKAQIYTVFAIGTMFFILMGFIIFAFSCSKDKTTPKERIESLSKVYLQDNVDFKYYKFDMSFDGALVLFAVIEFDEEPVQFLSEYRFEKDGSTKLATDSSILYGVPQEYHPDLNEPHLIANHNYKTEPNGVDSCFLYYPNTLELKIMLFRN